MHVNLSLAWRYHEQSWAHIYSKIIWSLEFDTREEFNSF